MGDNLPEALYRAFVNGMGLSYGSDDTPGWNNLSTAAREAWEQVAAKARKEMHGRFLRDMRDARKEFGAEQALANLLDDQPEYGEGWHGFP